MEAYVEIGYFRGVELLYQDVIKGEPVHSGRSDDGLAVHEVHESIDFLRRRLPRGDFSRTAQGGDQRHNSPGLRQPHDNTHDHRGWERV